MLTSLPNHQCHSKSLNPMKSSSSVSLLNNSANSGGRRCAASSSTSLSSDSSSVAVPIIVLLYGCQCENKVKLYNNVLIISHKSLRSISRTSQKMHNKEGKNIYKSHWSISRIFGGNLFDKIQHQEQTFHLERQFKIKIE